MAEHTDNPSTSITNMAELLAARRRSAGGSASGPARPPAIFLEHYVEERTPDGRLGRKATWDRLWFEPWTPRRIWQSGQERLSFGELHWKRIPEQDVEALLSRDEMRALPPEVPHQDDQPWSGVPPGL
jgi:hypothetical protein